MSDRSQDKNSAHGTWVAGCPQCDGEVFVKDAAIIQTKTCDNCRDFLTGHDPVVDVHEVVGTELEWCGCDRPEEVDRMMLAYLEARAVEDFPKPHPEGVSEDAETLLAYIADQLGWTEHGGSVGGAWLSPAGETALNNLRRYASEQEQAHV